MKHKIAKLEGALLDAAVDLAEHGEILSRVGSIDCVPYSTDWRYGQPIIDLEHIEIGGWLARMELGLPDGMHVAKKIVERVGDSRRVVICVGPTPLVAAMRTYLLSKFGEEVELS